MKTRLHAINGMAKVFLTFILFLSFSLGTYSALSVKGYYTGKPLEIQNPVSEDGFGFSISKITVNGQPIIQSIQTATIRINFASLGLKIGEPVLIEIEHADGSLPLVLNPEDLLDYRK